MKLLHVGDVHAKPNELADCSALMGFVLEVAQKENVDAVVLSGDQYHHHAIVHLAVMGFWTAVFSVFQQHNIRVIALVGNHDCTPTSNVNAMMAHQNVRVIDHPVPWHGVLFVPHMSSRDEFVGVCQRSNCSTVVCHQTFNGGTYDNGFYAKDGVEPESIPQKDIISGHIHTPQVFGKVFYLGSPRWQTLSDANVDRAIWLVEYNDYGEVVKKTPYDTGEVCTKIVHLVDEPDSPISLPLNPLMQWRIDIKGPVDFVERRKKEICGPGIRIRTFPDSTSFVGQVRESDGIQVAFSRFLSKFEPKHGTSKQVLENMLKERLSA